jgi:hypothetical protein
MSTRSDPPLFPSLAVVELESPHWRRDLQRHPKKSYLPHRARHSACQPEQQLFLRQKLPDRSQAVMSLQPEPESWVPAVYLARLMPVRSTAY